MLRKNIALSALLMVLAVAVGVSAQSQVVAIKAGIDV